MQVESLSAKIYQQKFKAVRIANIILCEKKSVEEYAAKRIKERADFERRREEKAAKQSTHTDWKQLRSAFEQLSDEERKKLLASLNGK